jgi:hypothetical protein
LANGVAKTWRNFAPAFFNTVMATFLFTLGIMAAFFALMSVRVFLKKDGAFQGTCATLSTKFGNGGMECTVCGKKVGEGECANAKTA